MTDNNKISRVRNLVGLQYMFLGRIGELPKTKQDTIRMNAEGLGIDCYGVCLVINRFLGRYLPDYTYEPDWYKNGKNYFLEEIEKYFDIFKKEEVAVPKLWDHVLIKIKSKVPNHIGICIGGGKFIHCVEEQMVAVSRLHDYNNFIKLILRYRNAS